MKEVPKTPEIEVSAGPSIMFGDVSVSIETLEVGDKLVGLPTSDEVGVVGVGEGIEPITENSESNDKVGNDGEGVAGIVEGSEGVHVEGSGKGEYKGRYQGRGRGDNREGDTGRGRSGRGRGEGRGYNYNKTCGICRSFLFNNQTKR